MVNIPPTTPERNPYKCRKCGAVIYWHRAQSGKNYPCDSATDRRAFHQCQAAPVQQPAKNPQTAQTPKALTPSYFNPESTLEERVSHLEEQVKNLARTVQAVQARQPIDDKDVAF